MHSSFLFHHADGIGGTNRTTYNPAPGHGAYATKDAARAAVRGVRTV